MRKALIFDAQMRPAELPRGCTNGQVASWNSTTGRWACGAAGAVSVSDTAYAGSWDGVTDVAPSKNAVYDKIESMTAASYHIDDILTALGIVSTATHFGTFTGSTIADSQTAKAALQALETALELRVVKCSGTNVLYGRDGTGTEGCYSSFDLVNLNITGSTSLVLGTASSLAGMVRFHNAANAYHFDLIPGSTGADLSWTFPIAAPGGNNYLVSASTAGVLGYTAITGTGSAVLATSPTIATPIITNPEVDGSATADWTSLPAKVSNTMIRNCGQAGVAATITLPTAAEGYAFIATVCEPSLTGTWKFLCSGTDHMTVDEVKGKHYVERLTTKVAGDKVTCWTAKNANDGVSSLTTLSTGSTVTAVANTAFKFVIAGVGYDKAADAVGIAPEVATTPQNKYGGQMLEIGVDGVIHANAGANIATGFDTEVAAADADAHAVTAAHVKIGTVTAMRTNVLGFIWGTTGFDDAETTETFHSQAVHTFGYGWNCQSGKTAWTTD